MTDRRLPPAIELLPSEPVHATVTAPPSKSATNRALVIAMLADGESTLRSPLVSDDTLRMVTAIRALGAEVETRDEVWIVRGTAGRPRVPEAPIDCGSSGTTMRFLCAAAALANGEVTLTGDDALLRRPIGPLVAALRSLGADATCADGAHPPVVVRGGTLRGGSVEIDASASSQFVSAVLLVSPLATGDVTIRSTELGATGYVEMTAQMMLAWGARIERAEADAWHVHGSTGYAARDHTVEYDASAAAHLLAFAMTTAGSITVANAVPTAQPDARIASLFTAMGAGVSLDRGVTVTGPAVLRPLEASLGLMPDQVGTIAVCAALAEGTSELHDLGVVRGHETDRLAAVASELRRVGIDVEERRDALVVMGGTPRAARIDTYKDHRMAMAFAALGARAPGMVIDDPACVSKTYPAFWDDIARAGVRWRPASA